MESTKQDNINKLIICVIEPVINQLLGAYILYQSLKKKIIDKYSFRVYIINNGICAYNFFMLAKDYIEFDIQLINPCKLNPYLNKLEFTNDTSLIRSDILLLDWDIIFNPTKNLELPICHSNVLYARANPTNIYNDIIKSLVLHNNISQEEISKFESSMSINTGVMYGQFEIFKFLKRHSEKLIKNRVIKKIAEGWRQEQFVLSLITKELHLIKLNDYWNYTPLSRIQEKNSVLFWHYNDSDPRTYELKRNLANIHQTIKLLNEIRKDWNAFANVFLDFYSRSTINPLFKKFFAS